MNEPRQAVLTGGCQCGAVRYALYARPEDVHLCHCRMCQKAVGNAFAALAPVRRRDFAWTRGTPAVFLSSSAAERLFCAACGTPLGFAYVDGDWMDPTIGSLDDPAAVAPQQHYGVESRVAWLDRLDGLPAAETETGGITGQARVIVSHQHPDRDTGAAWVPAGGLAPEIVRQRLLVEGHFTAAVDADAVRAFLLDVAAHLSLRTYGEPVVHAPAAGDGRTENAGFDAFVPLIDSGISLYVWTGPRFLSAVFYTCKHFDADAAAAFTRDRFAMTGEMAVRPF